MSELARGTLQKMRVKLDNPVTYAMELGKDRMTLNPLLGKHIVLDYLGEIHCIHCGRTTKKSFNQGYCYPCFQKLAQCDSCVIAPERCHYAAGTCREPVWGDEFCMRDHIVYLANSSGLKVGITRASQIPTRWIDQGAIQALPIMRVRSRQQSGFAEVIFRQHVTDRTNWRSMLKGDNEPLDMEKEKDNLLELCSKELKDLEQQFGLNAVNILNGVDTISISYPVTSLPEKISSLDLDKNAKVEGQLLGIKGQYLILDAGVINIRKYTGYQVAISDL